MHVSVQLSPLMYKNVTDMVYQSHGENTDSVVSCFNVLMCSCSLHFVAFKCKIVIYLNFKPDTKVVVNFL